MTIKNILLALPMLTLPLTAMAQSNPEKLPGSITNAVTDKFAPIVCHQGLKKAIEEVQKCYQKTPAKYLQIEHCMVADVAVVMMTNVDNINRKKNNIPPQYTTSYINPNQYAERVEKYRKIIPEYQNYDQQDFLKYIGEGMRSLINKLMLMKQDKTIHCVE
ncbi:unnamed protein product [Commensalibacter communis]|uniref:hypothetical protein n=1 Tax=Commensalibacter communis TaxID=2972786 RepID=UPI0022FF9AE4|nr:hypothetical protein [Commensalibacter communis]CAI3950014.1 unnamed protein product [Commensalibacter communis]